MINKNDFAKNEEQGKIQFTSKPSIAIFVIGMTVFFTLYEFVKDKFAPDLTLWESHAVSICVVAVLSMISFLWFRGIVIKQNKIKNKIYQELLKEVAERRLTEKALKESEHFLKESQKIAHIGSYVIDLNSKTWSGTAETYRMFGIDESFPHTREGLLELVHPDSIEFFTQQYYQAEFRHKNFDFEYKIRKADSGEVRWIHGYGGFDHNEQTNSNRLICTVRDITERKQREEENYYLSYHDQLTGLYNRRYYEEELKRLDTKRNLPMTIAIGDVNGLKLINDSFGHAAGDELLKKSAEILKECCRKDEIIARIGGDEFVLILPKTNANEAERLVKRIKSRVQSQTVENIPVSISFGYETKQDEEELIQEVIKKAEDYMYKKKLFESQSLRGKTISSIISTLHEKNKREQLHSSRVSDLCERMGAALGMAEYEIMELKTVGLFHDIGKIAIDEDILNKKEMLTEDEWNEMKRHSEIGYRILSTANDMSEMADYVLAHHERWDGKGYPKGLKEEEIPLVSRIIAIADSFDAMTSESCYQDIFTEAEAIEILRRNAGVKFDPYLVDVFVQQVLKGKIL